MQNEDTINLELNNVVRWQLATKIGYGHQPKGVEEIAKWIAISKAVRKSWNLTDMLSNGGLPKDEAKGVETISLTVDQAKDVRDFLKKTMNEGGVNLEQQEAYYGTYAQLKELIERAEPLPKGE